MIKRTKLALLLLLILTSISTQASFNDAINNYEQGKFEEAFLEFQSLAEVGHKPAQFNLGLMYVEGIGTEVDLTKGYGWIKLSDKDVNNEQALLKEIFNSLDKAAQQEAEYFYNVLNASYSEEALAKALEPIYKPVTVHTSSNPTDAKPIKQQPPKYPVNALVKGVEGWVKLAFKLDREGTPSNIQVLEAYPGDTFVRPTISAVSRWEFEAPKTEAEQNKIYTYSLKYHVDKSSADNDKAIRQLKEQALAGDPLAQYMYAKYAPYVDSSSNINPTYWYHEAAKQGLADAQYELANNLLNGRGCEKDKEKAINWLIKSASANLGRSQFKLAKLFFQVDDKEKAYFWLNKAVAADDSEIALELAEFLFELKDERYPLPLIIEQLNEVDLDKYAYPINYYEFIAKLHYLNGQYESAVENQEEAHSLMRRIKTVPEYMQDKLAIYEEALSGQEG